MEQNVWERVGSKGVQEALIVVVMLTNKKTLFFLRFA